MSKLRAFLRLDLRDKCFLVKVAFLMLIIKLGLAVIPFSLLLNLLRAWREGRSGTRVLDPKSVERATWGIEVMSPYIPGATCLTRALAALTLLGNLDQTVCVRIGIAKKEDGGLTAHAWVEIEGQILMGNQLDLSRYAVLSPANRQRINERHFRNI